MFYKGILLNKIKIFDSYNTCRCNTERMILLKDLKFCWIQIWK